MSGDGNPEAGNDRRTIALLGGAALAAAALLAHAGRLAETPLAALSSGLAAIGPGAVGQIKALPLDAQGLPPIGSQALAARALAEAPLSYEPFFVAGAASFRDEGGRTGGAGSAADAALLQEALRRNPRAREAHFLLLRHAVAQGDVKAAIGELAVMNRLTTGIADKLMPGVGMAILTQQQADDAVAGLSPYPELFEPFLRGFAEGKKSHEIAVRLVTHLPRSGLADPQVRDLAIAELIKAQAYPEARALWGGSERVSELLHSPDFADSKSPPPFNWKLAEDETGVAERSAGSGLSVEFYGRVPGPIATQLLTLAPGTYKVRMLYRNESGTPGALGLQLRCEGAEAPVFEQPLDTALGTSQALTVSFPIPAQGCTGQRIAIVGRVQETRNAQAASLRRIDVEREGPR